MKTLNKKKDSKSVISPKKTWSKMTIVEKRKSIAQDVIFNIKAKIIVPSKGKYCSLNFNNYSNKSKEFQEKLGKKNSCVVCAMGAMMATDIINRNNRASSWDSSDIKERFKKIFSILQLKKIECCFEKYDVGRNFNDDLLKKLIKFGKRYSSDKNRLIAIMENIIKDPKGLFNP